MRVWAETPLGTYLGEGWGSRLQKQGCRRSACGGGSVVVALMVVVVVVVVVWWYWCV